MSKAKASSKDDKFPHTVSFHQDGEDVVVTVATKAHAEVLTKRLSAHGIPFVYEGPKDDIVE